MTAFEKEKRKIRISRLVLTAAAIYLVLNSMATLLMDIPLYSSKTERLMAIFCYWSMIILPYFQRNRKCIRCKNDITAKELKNMDSFVCPYCGNTDFED